MKVIRLILTTALFGCFLLSFSQKQLAIEGAVLDSQTNELIPFASVSVKGYAVGTISNIEGQFVFNIPVEYREDTLIASCMGFDRFEIAISKLQQGKFLEIRLEPSTIELEEIAVSEDKLSGDQIIEKVIEKIATFYPTSLFLMKGYFREFKKVNSEYVSLKEAAVSIYDKKGYGSKNRNYQDEKVIIDEIRKSKEFYNHWLNELRVFPSSYNEVAHLFVHNDPKYLKRMGLHHNRLNYRWDTTLYQNQKPIYLVSVAEHPQRKFYVTEDFYITQIQEHVEYDDEVVNTQDGMVGDSLVQVINSWKNDLYFREFEGKYYPSYMSEAYKVSLNHPESGETVYTTEYSSELLINDIKTEGVVFPVEKDQVARGSLSNVSYDYNPAFWKNYNIIKSNPLDEKLIKDLERKVSLEQQFRTAKSE